MMKFKTFFKYLTSGFLLFFIYYQYGHSIYKIIYLVDYKYIILIIFISILQYIFSAIRWMYISKHTDLKLEFFYSLKFYYIASFFNNILPGGIVGDIYRIYQTSVNKKEISKMGKSLQSVIYERLSGQIMLLLVFLVSLTFYFLVNAKYAAFLILFVLCFTIFFIGKIFFQYSIKKFIITESIRKNLNLLFSGKIFWRHLFYSFLVVSSYILIYIISALSLNLEIDYLAFLVFSPIILFSMTLPISIGGWGIRELTALLISFLLGLSASASISVSIIYGVLNLLCSFPGLLFFLYNFKLR